MKDMMNDTDQPRPLRQSLLRGLRGRCPHCGEGAMFARFLKVSDHCPACDEALHHQRADDAPAYFVIAIVGHIIVPMALSLEMAFVPPYWVHFALWVPLTIALSLLLLTPVKGTLVALQWALRMHGFEHASRPASLAAKPAATSAP